MRRIACLALVFTSLSIQPANLYAADPPAKTAPAAQQAGKKAEAGEQKLPDLPHIRIDRKKRIVDLEGVVVLREADWIELLACMPRSRVHESIITVQAKPSHIHGALLIAGYKPGHPWKAEKDGDKWKYFPAKGEHVRLSILYKDKNGKTVTAHPHDWIIENQTNKKLPDSIWMFTGSRMHNVQGKKLYAADLEGNLFSLVNFGDEVMARSTKLAGGQGGAGGDTWRANTKAIPAVGTKLILRIQPVKKAGKSGSKKDAGKKTGK